MSSIQQYISSFPPEIQDRLNEIRRIFFDEIPHTKESIRYSIPSFTVGKDHLYFAAFKKHIGLYPLYDLPGIEDQIAPYRAKGTTNSLHFSHNKPLPIELIRLIIKTKESQK
ncbi:MAG: DUF1801 domain-containing protein [Bacteroidetes bacterium]|nr:DUF1801 domain-containing protein [Bacteroidota bacterium]